MVSHVSLRSVRRQGKYEMGNIMGPYCQSPWKKQLVARSGGRGWKEKCDVQSGRRQVWKRTRVGEKPK